VLSLLADDSAAEMERLSLECDWAALNVTLRDPAAWEAYDVPGRERLVVSLATVMKDMASTTMQLWGVTSMNKLIEKIDSAAVMSGGVPWKEEKFSGVQ
jgi:hypothetical protein